MTIYVAVVCRGATAIRSLRTEGDWSCFLGHTKEEAIKKALGVARRWGNYEVLVGSLPYQVRPKAEWELVKI